MSVGEHAPAQGSRRGRLAPVRRVTDDRAHLYRLIQTIGAGPDLDAILRGVVHLVTEATACHACFVYFLRDGRLTLRVASPMYEHLEGAVVIPLGEGLTGWVASAGRSAFIREGALADPRVRRASFPELGDDVYQSLVSVPIFSRSGGVAGVITLHAEAPHEFGQTDLDFLEHTASLIAGAVENARLYEDATARIAMLSELGGLSTAIASAADEREVLELVRAGVRSLLRADACEIARTGPEARVRPRGSRGRSRARAITDPTEAPSIAADLVAGDERLGRIEVWLSSDSPDAEDASNALTTVAAHTAVALRQHQVIGRLHEQNLLKDLFRALARGGPGAADAAELARHRGWDLDAPHLVVHLARWRGVEAPRPRGVAALPWRDRAAQLEGRLAGRFRDLLVDHLEDSLRAIVPLRDATPDDAVDALRRMEWGDGLDAVAVGVSDVCRGARSFARGFEEAAAAAEVGALIRGTPGPTRYEELGPYRYVLRADEELRDRSQERLDRLVEYDDRRGTRLLDTLEAYLDHRGNVVATARFLYIHPNTLRQRLDRIERLSGLDLERSDWLSLAVATKVVKLRRMRRAAGQEGRDDG